MSYSNFYYNQDLNDLSVKELKELAKSEKIKGYGSLKKNDLINILYILSLNNLTVVELKELAKEKKVKNYSGLKKNELVDLLIKSKNEKIVNDIDEKEELILFDNDLELPFDLINYGIQGYLNYDEEVLKLEKLFNKKLDINQHIHYEEEYWDKDKTKIKQKTTYFDGKKIKTEKWYENGTKLSDENYKNGILDGLQRIWHKNGNIEAELNLKNGLQDGLQIAWFPSGKLVHKIYYENGKFIGLMS
jgi:antitoxin component YwqK of YwqJK toxin-antitoxin module